MTGNTDQRTYQFEQGPIRPPSESESLLLRLTRNCPWNRCTFCPVYKGTGFSIRTVDEIIYDVDSIHKYVEKFRSFPNKSGRGPADILKAVASDISPKDEPVFLAAWNWYYNGGIKSIFLQDANSLVMKPAELIYILSHIKKLFPSVERITSYARSKTISRIKLPDLINIGKSGLNRIHIGLESGSDKVLEMVKKGSTKENHITAGLNVKKAGIELSEYYIPGLGGESLSDEHAVESADAINRINPDYIRLRTLAIPCNAPLYESFKKGEFRKRGEVGVIEEILKFTEDLNGITSHITSDHILNHFADFEGNFPQDKSRLIKILTRFLKLIPDKQTAYLIGRRTGIFSTLDDMDKPGRMTKVENYCNEYNITPENVDNFTEKLLNRFI